MITPAEIQDMHDRETGDLREIAAHIAGVLAHREGGYAPQTAAILRRIADRLEGQPRRAAA